MASYADDIRRIAREKALKGGLGELGNRDPILGNVTPFIDTAFAPDSTGTAPEDKIPETTDPNDPNTFNKGDGSGGADAGSGGGGGQTNQDGPQTADDLVDDKAGPTLPDDPFANPFSGGSLNKVSGLVDCTTGQCVTLSLDGVFPSPPGWEGPDQPPPDDTWQLGYSWFKELASGSAATPRAAAEMWATYASGIGLSGNSNFAITTLFSQTEILYRYNYTNTDVNGHPAGGVVSVKRESCAGSTTGICSIDNPGLTEWPPDGCYDLALQNGQVKTNDFDSEAPVTGETSSVNLCTADGKEVTIRAAANGGSMMYPTVGGAPSGTMKVYNSDGTMRMAGDATQTNISSQLPR